MINNIPARKGRRLNRLSSAASIKIGLNTSFRFKPYFSSDTSPSSLPLGGHIPGWVASPLCYIRIKRLNTLSLTAMSYSTMEIIILSVCFLAY